MAGPNLELFKFGMYLFFPLAIMVHYGDPDWYAENVKPIRDQFWPAEGTSYKPPRDTPSLKAELAELRTERLSRAAAKVEGAKASAGASAASAAAPVRGARAAQVTQAAQRPFALAEVPGSLRDTYRAGESVTQTLERRKRWESERGVRLV